MILSQNILHIFIWSSNIYSEKQMLISYLFLQTFISLEIVG